MLTKSLHPSAYDHNPGFLSFIDRGGLPFKSHTEFLKADLDDRQELYIQLASQIWSPDRLEEEVELAPTAVGNTAEMGSE